MNRNTELHFAEIPSVDIGRSKFDRSHTKWGTMDAGKLYPIYCDCTIMPGDTVKMRTSELVRMMTPVAPVMDDCFMDTYFFFVPYRLVWDNFKQFMGENETAPWTQTTEYEIPQIKCDYEKHPSDAYCDGFGKGSVADYMGYPVFPVNARNEEDNDYVEYTASVLPFRAYALIWNEFFRDENLQNPVHIYKDEVLRYPITNSDLYDYVQYTELGGGPCLNVCKVPDYFTMCLPQPQKGPQVALALGGKSPVNYQAVQMGEHDPNWNDLRALFSSGTYNVRNQAGSAQSTVVGTSMVMAAGSLNPDGTQSSYGPKADGWEAASIPDLFALYADLDNATGMTINALRQAFAVQKFYERQARGGTRYIEMVKSHFGVTNPDFRMQRPEYLGGHRTLINMNQVIANSGQQDYSQPLGTPGGYSVTLNQEGDLFTHSFTEHGILMGLCCIRQNHSYSQGLNRQFSMKKLTDFYFPEFANLGEQAVLRKEIYITGLPDTDEEAFGYQEAWAHYRYYPSQAVGGMRPSGQTGLGDIWTYGDYYTEHPELGDKWIMETKENINRTIYTQEEDQFMFNMYFGAIYTRPMPLYSIPGLIDHH